MIRHTIRRVLRTFFERGYRRFVGEQVAVSDNVRVALHDLETLRDRYPDWDSLDKAEKLRRARDVPPDRVVTASNLTTTGHHELLVDVLDETQSTNEDASHLAVGTDDGTDPSSGNSSLNNEVYRTTIAETTDNGATLFTSTFLDSTEANGNDLVEVGLVTSDSSGSDILLNHSIIDVINKDDETTATIDVELTYANP